MIRKNLGLVLLVLLSTKSLGAEPPTWEKISDEDGIITYKMKEPGQAIVGFKGDSIIDAPLAKVTSMMTDADNLIKWLPDTAEIKLLKKISESEWIVYVRSKVPIPFDDRDFVIKLKIEINRATQTVKILEKSVEDPAYPSTDKYVRADLLYNNYTLESRDNGTKTFVSLELACDPKGNLPLFVVNAFQKDSPRNMLKAMKARVQSPEVVIDPKVTQALETQAK